MAGGRASRGRRPRPLWAGLNLAEDDLPQSQAGNFYPLELVRAVCLLDVPAHKTGTAFTQPVNPVLCQALDAWQAVRPAQPRSIDRRTGELVDLLFAFRAPKISTTYINNTVIPVLRRKAGVPAADVRGNITSHRARSTIASQLYNAKEPMTLFELQAWLGTGHRSPPSSTRTLGNCVRRARNRRSVGHGGIGIAFGTFG